LKEGDKVVVSVKPGSFCEGLLFEKDVISHVNGRDVRDIPLDDFVGLFVKTEQLDLTVVRSVTSLGGSKTTSSAYPNASTSAPEASRQPEAPTTEQDLNEITVTLSRDSFETRLGIKMGIVTSGEKVVATVTQGSYCDGLLFMYDIISHIDGVDVKAISLEDFQIMLTQHLKAVLTVLRRGPSPEPAREPLSVASPELAAPDAIITYARLGLHLSRKSYETEVGLKLGCLKSGEKIVVYVKGGSLAEGQLREGDIIYAVDGMPVKDIPHDEFTRMLGSKLEMKLTVLREHEAGAIVESLNLSEGTSQVVHLERDTFETKFGYEIGMVRNGDKVVCRVNPGGICEGRLLPGDIVTHVDNAEAKGLSHDEFVDLLQSKLSTNLSIVRYPRPEPLTDEFVQPLNLSLGTTTTVLLERNSYEEQIGVKIGMLSTGERIVMQVLPGGMGQGILVEKDIITHMDGEDVSHLSHEEFVERISQSLSTKLTIVRGIEVDLKKATSLKPKALDLSRGTSVQVRMERKSIETKLGMKVGMLNSGEKVVLSVTSGTVCDGLLYERDIITHVDGEDITSLTHDEFVGQLLQKLSANLTVVRALGANPTKAAAGLSEGHGVVVAGAEPDDPNLLRKDGIKMSVPLNRTSDLNLGVKVGMMANGEKVVIEVTPGLVCEGLLEVGDIITHIDDMDVSGLSHSDFARLMGDTLNSTLGIVRGSEIALPLQQSRCTHAVTIGRASSTSLIELLQILESP
jgi:C-terminal processing protease CtpA/Prc